MLFITIISVLICYKIIVGTIHFPWVHSMIKPALMDIYGRDFTTSSRLENDHYR